MEQNNLQIKPSDEPKLIKNGPVFEAGPGWGAKIKTWFGKYLFKVILPIVIIGLVIYGFVTRNKNSTDSNGLNFLPQTTIGKTIVEIVAKGEGKTHIARRAITDYIQGNPDQSLTPGERIYLENMLSQKIVQTSMATDTEIKFNEDDILSLIDQYNKLAKTQIEKWDSYAKGVKF